MNQNCISPPIQMSWSLWLIQTDAMEKNQYQDWLPQFILVIFRFLSVKKKLKTDLQPNIIPAALAITEQCLSKIDMSDHLTSTRAIVWYIFMCYMTVCYSTIVLYLNLSMSATVCLYIGILAIKNRFDKSPQSCTQCWNRQDPL